MESCYQSDFIEKLGVRKIDKDYNNNNNTVEHAGDNYTNCNWCVWNSN